MPERIQLRRTKGWRKPEGAVVVARPTKWGNPFAMNIGPRDEGGMTREQAVAAYRYWAQTHILEYLLREIRGRDLACWCPLVDAEGNHVPCHADVLLEIANEEDE